MSTELIIGIGSAVATIAILVYMNASRSGARESTIRNLISTGLLHEQKGEWLEAKLALEGALKEMEASGTAPDIPQQVTCLLHLATVYERLGESQLAGLKFKEVIRNWDAQLKSGKLNLIDVDYAVTNLNFGRGTLDVVEFYIDNVVVLREKSLPKGHPDIEMSHKIGAGLLRKAGYTQEAEILLNRGK